MNTYTLILPLPDPCLSPNARVHWAKKGRAVKELRRCASLVALAEMTAARVKPPRWKTATVQVTAYYPVKRRRDKDNLVASLKAAFDGLVDAGMLEDDDGLTHLPTVIDIDAMNPRVVMVVTGP